MDRRKTEQAHMHWDITQIEREIGNLEHTLQESYCDAGKTILEAAETESRKINKLVDRVVELRKQMVEMRGDLECESCGAYNDNRSLYCGRCGGKLGEKREEQSE